MYKIDKIQKESKRFNIITKTISIIIYMLLIPIIIFSFIIIAKSIINPNEIPDFFGYKNFVIVSGSMEPTIMKKDAIFIKEVPKSEINVNDIISFNEDDVVVTHRVIEIINEDGITKYKTKGDNNNSADRNLVTYDQIEGKYQFKINQFGIIIEILKNKLTLFILVAIIIFTSLYQNRLNKRKKERKDKRNKLT